MTILLQRSNERRLPGHYAGDVLLWDIDKTYLDTRFSSWRGLLAIPFEFAIDKRTIPGAVPLLRALRRGPGEHSAIVPLYFVSGSPPQLRRVIERRMTLDGVDFDGITFKDQWALLRKGRIAEIRAQVGYKLAALLLYRREIPSRARWLCFGDDVEADAEVFGLFAEVCTGLRGTDLVARLQRMAVPRHHITTICDIAAGLPMGVDPVEKIFIHLERGLRPESFPDRRVVPTRSYIQTALVLCGMGRISPGAISTVARDLRLNGMADATLQQHVDDAAMRLGVATEWLPWALQGART